MPKSKKEVLEDIKIIKEIITDHEKRLMKLEKIKAEKKRR